MRLRFYLLFLLLSGICLQSCKKRGCTNIHATNYSSDAGQDDGTCAYGAFSVHDSVMEVFQNDTITNGPYTIEFVKAYKEKNTYYLLNYFNKKKFNGKQTKTICHIYDNLIVIPKQTVMLDDNPHDFMTSPYIHIKESKGYFSNDSIFIDMVFTYQGYQYKGACQGSR